MRRLTVRFPLHWAGLWLLVALVNFAGGQSAPAQTLSTGAAPARRAPVTIRGVVLDDSLRVPVTDAWLYLNGTSYGAITNEAGEFALTFPPDWKPVRGGQLVLQVAPIPFVFKAQQARLDWRSHDPAQVLMLRLASAPGRGRPHLHGTRWKLRPVAPPTYPASRHGIRP